MSGKHWKCAICQKPVLMHEVKWIACANCPSKVKQQISDLEAKVKDAATALEYIARRKYCKSVAIHSMQCEVNGCYWQVADKALERLKREG